MEQETKEQEAVKYNPPKKDTILVARVYSDFSHMRDVTNDTYKYFNDRTLTQFIDDSEKRFIGYVPSRSSQGKESWQSNFFHPVTRNKTMAILASVALDIPQIRIAAKNEKEISNIKVGKIIADLTKASFDNEDKEEKNFFSCFEAAVKGTVIEHDGYIRTKIKKKEITSFDVVTGEVVYKEVDNVVDKGCDSFVVPLENFFIYDAYIRDLQKQPRIIWAQYMNQSDFEYEFGNYANFKHVKIGAELIEKDVQKRYFFDDWVKRTEEKPIEVIRYFDKGRDEHVIIANGVKMLESPLLLGDDEKYYPFSKTIHAPFAEAFFWGNSLPNLLMGENDVINALYNTSMDKNYKSLTNNLIIGNINKDDFDLEDEDYGVDTRVYVQDINQVREMPNSGVSSSEFNMIDLIGRGLDLSSVDANQQGVTGKGVTAREVVIANEKARQLKGIFFLFITSFWLQKMTIRMMNVLSYYTDMTIGKTIGEKNSKMFKKFMIENAELSDGKRGTKGIIIAEDKKSLPTKQEINDNVEEYKSINGEDANYEEVAITAKYLKNWKYTVKIITESLYQKEGSYAVSKVEDKIKIMATLFPQFFEKNQVKLFKDTLISYDEDPDEYDIEEEQPNETPEDGSTSTEPVTAPPTQPDETAQSSLPNLSGLPASMQ